MTERLRFCSVGHPRPYRVRECPICHPPLMSARPLRLWVIRSVRRAGSVEALAAEVAERTDAKLATTVSDLKKIIYGTRERISLWKADRLAVGLGLTPHLVWGDEWHEAHPWPDLERPVDDWV